MIPLKIFFGAHLHIQVYPAFTDTCPFCEEERILKQDRANLISITPAQNYINRRLNEIKLYDTDGSRYFQDEFVRDDDDKEIIIPEYFPKTIDVKKVFYYRDRIGKLASYRTFFEYLNEFNNSNETNDIEIWMCVLLHEPKLIKIVEQRFNNN